jgi:cold shock CspA family protein
MANNARLIGQVKWFDKKKGYGFLQDVVTKSDFFVHHSALQVHDNETFRFLVVGEYVEYSLVPSLNNNKHKTIAADVTGMKRGLLMCEYQAQFMKARGDESEEEEEEDEEKK